MSYSDEIPGAPKQNGRRQALDLRGGARPDAGLIQPPPPVDPPPAPVSDAQPAQSNAMPAPRQAIPPGQQQPPAQRVPNQRQQPQRGPAGHNMALTPRQQQAPIPQQRPPTQQRPAPTHPAAPGQVHQPPPQAQPRPQAQPPQQQQAPPATETAPPPGPAAPVSAPARVVEERPSAPVDKSTLSFESGSTGPKADAKDLLLDTDGLVKIYDGRTVVNGVNINVKRGEIVGLLGPNGAGKTTSFYMMVGLVPPNGGRVMFDGKDVTKLPMYKRARLGMGYLPQEESIFRKLTVEENIMAVMQTMKYSRKEKKAKCEELLERFSITHIRKNIAMACSGGEKRRVTIARSLVPNPSLIMLDEPFGGVDPIAVGEIQSIVKDLRKEGLAVLITDHNARETLDLVDRAYLICEGKVLREGPKEFLVNDPVSRQLYLGERFSM